MTRYEMVQEFKVHNEADAQPFKTMASRENPDCRVRLKRRKDGLWLTVRRPIPEKQQDNVVPS